MKTVLLTGAAGFIGSHIARKFLTEGWRVVGIDNLNDYYDVTLKQHRLDELSQWQAQFQFIKGDIESKATVESRFQIHKFDLVVNLAARAGVRYSQENPDIYYSTNVLGTLNILELMKKYECKKIITASTSSAYGDNVPPFQEDMDCSTPLSPYAASKLAMESLCFTYHHLYGMDCIIPRFYTVYGPCGRPDMSYFKFIKQISEGLELTLNGDGEQRRDFTFVEDIVEGVWLSKELSGFEIINLGGDQPYSVNDLIGLIEKGLGKKANIIYRPFSMADMKVTNADIAKARRLLRWSPQVSLAEGIGRSIQWYISNKEIVSKISLVES